MLKRIAKLYLRLSGVREPDATDAAEDQPKHRMHGPRDGDGQRPDGLDVRHLPLPPQRNSFAAVPQAATRPMAGMLRASVDTWQPAPHATPSPVLAATSPAQHRPSPAVQCVDPTTVHPPTFGRVPKAASVSWHLTVEPTTSGIAADQAKLGDLHVRAASIVGPSHRCEEPAVARQDSYRLGRDTAGQYLIVAVADGMSDSRRSDIGAMVAARCAVDVVRERLDSGVEPDEAMLQRAFQCAASAMVTAAHESRLPDDAVRSALILAIVPAWPENKRGERVACFGSLADVSAWERTGPNWHQFAGDPKDAGMDRNHLRHFLPHYPNHVRTTSRVLPRGATITIVTDGVGDAFTDIPGGAQWFANRWQSPMPLESFLLDVGYHASGQLDDRTAVTVWCDPDDRR